MRSKELSRILDLITFHDLSVMIICSRYYSSVFRYYSHTSVFKVLFVCVSLIHLSSNYLLNYHFMLGTGMIILSEIDKISALMGIQSTVERQNK